jgi:hypothetical protein
MGMAIEHSRIVLQNEELLKSSVLLQVDEPLPISKKDLLDLRGPHESETLLVLRCLHYDFMGTDGFHYIIHPLRPSVELSLNMEEWKFIGNDPDRPSPSFTT